MIFFMEAVIKVRPEELNTDLFNRLQGLVKNNNLEIVIQLRKKSTHSLVPEAEAGYLTQLNNSLEDRLNGRTVSFTAAEFEKYVKDNFSE